MQNPSRRPRPSGSLPLGWGPLPGAPTPSLLSQKIANDDLPRPKPTTAARAHWRAWPAARTVGKGTAEVFAHYDQFECTTAGLDALCLRFGDRVVTRWEGVGGGPGRARLQRDWPSLLEA